MPNTTASQISPASSLPEWQAWYGRNLGNTVLIGGQPAVLGQDVGPNEVLQAFRQGSIGWGAQQPDQTIGSGLQPEQVALGQMAQIDPATEALRQQVANTYLQSVTPNAAQMQSYLQTAAQVDPTSMAARQQLGTDLASQEALGTQLDAGTQRQVDQATREAQIARGNVYGTPQMVEEAMTRGQAGLGLQQQRQQALQGYLSSGQTPGDVAMNLFNQQQNQLQRSLGYLTSGATPYQAASGYLNNAQQQAAMAAQGGPQFAPAGPSPYYTGAGASSFPQYGLDTSQTSANWYNLMNAYNPPAASGGGGQSKGASAGMGALKGAASGALTGMAGGPWGALIGAGVGAVGGAASGYFG
jgi:hypothetical protein